MWLTQGLAIYGNSNYSHLEFQSFYITSNFPGSSGSIQPGEITQRTDEGITCFKDDEQ